MNEFQVSNGIFFPPFQPNLEIDTDYYIEHRTNSYLHQTSLLFYQFQSKEKEQIPVIPDGCVDILFCCQSENSYATIYGSVYHEQPITIRKNCEYFGVRIPPAYTIEGLKPSMKEIFNRNYPLAETVPLMTFIEELFVKEHDFQGKVKLFMDYFGPIIKPNYTSKSLIGHGLNHIYTKYGQTSIQELAEETGYSTRYLRKKFNDNIGISPKLLSDIIRFQFALRLLKNKYAIEDVIFESGYYDQPHIIKEFKKFGSITPQQFINTFNCK
ncbi:helix-turn-helix domain-containing protein [Salicibibacter kimchii]|uniref:AraC family transcriptional regulator n=1 Tax=Salicibibacter kimchii TaxID=2099786 RepID=A0A345C1E0_9BACI|nr:helix-turn-helix transcriptional regulator [Salicibibacter kimchii]AXF57021.1 AraC family transcriptional regulator [Salicibibacter kimchii]